MEKQSENETKSTVESTDPAEGTLGEKELEGVSGGLAHDDESPKETVTFNH